MCECSSFSALTPAEKRSRIYTPKAIQPTYISPVRDTRWYPSCSFKSFENSLVKDSNPRVKRLWLDATIQDCCLAENRTQITSQYNKELSKNWDLLAPKLVSRFCTSFLWAWWGRMLIGRGGIEPPSFLRRGIKVMKSWCVVSKQVINWQTVQTHYSNYATPSNRSRFFVLEPGL